jgi:hypothetical protein
MHLLHPPSCFCATSAVLRHHVRGSFGSIGIRLPSGGVSMNDPERLWHDAAMRWPSGFICLERELLEPACGSFLAELRVD